MDIISKSEIQLLNKFDSMLIKTANLDAQVKRLNSLGKVIAGKNNVDIEAYLLSQNPAIGGLDGEIMNFSNSIDIINPANLVSRIFDIESEIELQEKRLVIIKKAHETLKARDLIEVKTTSKPGVRSFSTPVSTGYVSSDFGKRRDPINGHQHHHNGIDIAAKHGSKINTIASGFVTFAGRKGGYGKVIDIHHSDTLKSRYAHLNSIKVKKGDVVRKGHTIATMGQTGRATGSHLHLEVWEKNRPVNPESYIDTALIK